MENLLVNGLASMPEPQTLSGCRDRGRESFQISLLRSYCFEISSEAGLYLGDDCTLSMALLFSKICQTQTVDYDLLFWNSTILKRMDASTPYDSATYLERYCF